MRVLHVINGLGPGGAERSLRDLLPHFARHGISSEIAVFHHAEFGAEAEVAALGVPVHSLAGTGTVRRLVAIRRLIRTRRPDVVFSTLFDANVLSRVAAIGTGTPVVSSIVNTSYGDIRNDPRVRSWRLEVVRLIDGLTSRRLGASFHALTNAVRDDAVATLGIPADRITVIPRGRDRSTLGEPTAEWRARAPRAELGVGDTFTVLTVGRREFQKGQITLIDAIAVLVGRGIEVTCLVAGRDGGESERLHAAVARSGIADHVRFLGHRDDVSSLLVAADVFAFPSRFEGLGGALIEAMAMGVPIVASDVPALREVLADGEYGVLVPVGDAKALANAIADIAGEPELAAHRAATARARFDDVYQLDRVGDAMSEWLGASAAQRRGR